jgi:uncharacterized membrane protein YuzA (DUF378 family)
MLFGSMSSWNLVGMIFGSMPMIEAIVYLLVGISAVMHVLGCKCKTCKGGVCVADAKVDASKPKGGQM